MPPPYRVSPLTILTILRFKQVASLFGDTTFQSSRRNFLQRANQYNVTQTWSYLFSQKRAGAENSYLGGESS